MQVEEASYKAVFVGGKNPTQLTAILLLQGPGKSRLAVVPARMRALGLDRELNRIRGFQMLSRQDQDRGREPRAEFLAGRKLSPQPGEDQFRPGEKIHKTYGVTVKALTRAGEVLRPTKPARGFKCPGKAPAVTTNERGRPCAGAVLERQ